MPYASRRQERWAHTASAKQKGFPTKEFDKASKGRSFSKPKDPLGKAFSKVGTRR